MPGAYLWGWDGAAWVKVRIDGTGHLQVDVLTSTLPAGAASLGAQNVSNDLLSLIHTLLGGGLPAALVAGALSVIIDALPSVAAATTGKVAIGAVSTAVLAANANRIFAQFVNDSDEEIYLDQSAVAVMNEGIRLNAEGGSFEINLTNLYTGQVAAICASGGKNLTVTEG